MSKENKASDEKQAKVLSEIDRLKLKAARLSMTTCQLQVRELDRVFNNDKAEADAICAKYGAAAEAINHETGEIKR